MAFPLNTVPEFNWNVGGGDTIQAIRQRGSGDVDGPAIIFSKIVPDATGLVPLTQGPTRAIIADVAGTITGHDAFGNAVATFPLQPGWNKVSLAGVTSIATTTQVWGVW